jgi:hypothetical protein
VLTNNTPSLGTIRGAAPNLSPEIDNKEKEIKELNKLIELIEQEEKSD